MFRPGQAVEGAGRVRRQPGVRFIGGEVGVDLVLLGNVDDFVGMREGEGVEDDHGRDADRFGDLEGLDGGVDDFLVARDVELHPAGVPLAEAVVLVRPDRPAGGHGPVDVAHDDRQPSARGPMEQFMHQGQALGRCRGERPGPGDGRADAGGHGRMLGFDLDELRLERSVGAHFRKQLDDLGLRGDRVSGDDLGSGEHRPVGQGVIAHDDFSHFRSSTITMHFIGHSAAQIPHPLQ